MERRTGAALWGAAGVAAGLWIVQTALANEDRLALRFVIGGLAVALVVGLVAVYKRVSVRAICGPAPEPVSLVLAGLAALALFAPAWWLMDLTDNALDHAAGFQDVPQPVTAFDGGLDAAAYETMILCSVALIPLIEMWLLWGLVQMELGILAGRKRAAWIAGGVGGAFLTLTAVQEIAPAMPWGLASLGGYLLIGLAAALVVYLTGSPWTGFAVYGTFAYASFALRDDLFRQFAGKDYTDPGWLTLIVLGELGAALCFQAIRFRTVRLAEPERRRANLLIALWLPLALIAAALVMLAVTEIQARG